MGHVWSYLKANPTLVTAGASFILALGAFVFSIISFRMARSATMYSDIDARYMDLLKLAATDPEFRDAELTADYGDRLPKEKVPRYEIYAFIAWNIVETIVDRSKKRFLIFPIFPDKLYETWKPVIREENNLHRNWLNERKNQHKFKSKFWQFIIKSKDFPCPECEKEKEEVRCKTCKELLELANAADALPVYSDSKSSQ